MEATLQASVAVDLATREDIEQHHAWLRDRLGTRVRATYRTVAGSGQIPNGSAAFSTWRFAFDEGPPAGRLWEVRRILVMGSSETDFENGATGNALSGAGALYVAPALSQCNVASCVWASNGAGPIPMFASFGRGVVVVPGGANLFFAVITGTAALTAAFPVNATLGVVDLPADAAEVYTV